MDSKGMDPVLKYCAVGRQLGYAMYLSLDAVTYVSLPYPLQVIYEVPPRLKANR